MIYLVVNNNMGSMLQEMAGLHKKNNCTSSGNPRIRSRILKIWLNQPIVTRSKSGGVKLRGQSALSQLNTMCKGICRKQHSHHRRVTLFCTSTAPQRCPGAATLGLSQAIKEQKYLRKYLSKYLVSPCATIALSEREESFSKKKIHLLIFLLTKDRLGRYLNQSCMLLRNFFEAPGLYL